MLYETESPSTLLKLDDYRVGFRTERGLAKAVDGVSYQLDSGKTLAIVGESGSGKTVLNRGIMGLLGSNVNESGSVKFQEEELVNTDRQKFWGKKMAMIFQDPMTSLNPVMKVGKQVAEPLRLHQGMSKKEARERTVELFTLVGIPEPSKRYDEYPHQLSGGMRQRVMISIALAIEPDLLIADEPTTSLDVTVQKYILDLLVEVQKESNMAMTIITHDLGVARGRADEILVMYGGRVMEHAPAEALFNEMAHPYTSALLSSIPKLDDPKHTRLTPIEGFPPDIVDGPAGCKFAARCQYAQENCLNEIPATTVKGDHSYACFYPIGTDENAKAFALNSGRGHTAAGLKIKAKEEVT
ncbi:MAG: ABC transporter ATP-binding protein [Actinomycetota bacterium]|nr:ABC transporter ATP-binding protein [Actinomycetota bacterium]